MVYNHAWIWPLSCIKRQKEKKIKNENRKRNPDTTFSFRELVPEKAENIMQLRNPELKTSPALVSPADKQLKEAQATKTPVRLTILVPIALQRWWGWGLPIPPKCWRGMEMRPVTIATDPRHLPFGPIENVLMYDSWGVPLAKLKWPRTSMNPPTSWTNLRVYMKGEVLSLFATEMQIEASLNCNSHHDWKTALLQA